MKDFAQHFAVTTATAPVSGRAFQFGQKSASAELTELTFAEIAAVAGGPEGEVGAGVIPPT
jgi:hypothetical protein